MTGEIIGNDIQEMRPGEAEMLAVSREYYDLRESDKQGYENDLARRLQDIPDRTIVKCKGFSQFTKLYFLCLKYGRNIIYECRNKNGKLVFGKIPALNFRGKSFVQVEVISIADGHLIIKGFVKQKVMGVVFPLLIRDSKGAEYEPVIKPYHLNDETGLCRQPIAEPATFLFDVPCKVNAKYSMFITSNGEEISVNPSFSESIGIERNVSHSFYRTGHFIIQYDNGALSLKKDNLFARLSAEKKLKKEAASLDDNELSTRILYRLKIQKLAAKHKLKDRVAFISTRSSDGLLANMQRVFDKVRSDKAAFSKLHMRNDPEDVLKAAELMYTSKVIVTDDYLFLLKIYGKAAGQKVVQLWHATGAFKKFGKDGTIFFPEVDASYHSGYDLVTVSSEYVRDIYAGAFQIDNDKVQATGVARTDEFFDHERRINVPLNIYACHPEIKGKEVILYAPTFRNIQGVKRAEFKPDLDFDRLSAEIGEDQAVVICPHPLMTEPVLRKKYDNIFEIRDLSTNDMMYVADLLITDYSSVIFEYSFFNKPILFYCYDLDRYDRDFYLDYNRDLPGNIIKTQDELIWVIKSRNYSIDERIAQFRDKYMGACDGHSTERIARIIDDMVKA